jgi:hypothetical protein
MGRIKNKKPRPSQQIRAELASPASTPAALPGPTADEVAGLAVDMWKVVERARGDGAGDRVLVACERAEERLRRIGFEVDTMIGRTYDTNLKVRVVDHDEADGPMVIDQCISPAVFYRGVLVREAEVVTKGEKGEAEAR